jgi:hypothetical protein
VDLSDLTQEQQWGLAYEVRLLNDQVDAQNVQITNQNKYIPRDQPEIPLKTRQTVEEYVMAKLAEMGTNGYRQLIAYKEQQALNMFRALPADQQEALIEQFNIPDVL